MSHGIFLHLCDLFLNQGVGHLHWLRQYWCKLCANKLSKKSSFDFEANVKSSDIPTYRSNITAKPKASTECWSRYELTQLERSRDTWAVYELPWPKGAAAHVQIWVIIGKTSLLFVAIMENKNDDFSGYPKNGQASTVRSWNWMIGLALVASLVGPCISICQRMSTISYHDLFNSGNRSRSLQSCSATNLDVSSA